MSASILARYLLVLGLLLFAQGALSLLRQISSYDAGWLLNGLLNADPLHAAIHIAWGIIMMASAVRLRHNARQLTSVAVVFGIFYVGLAFLGTLLNHPFGLQLDFFENAFHWTVGPLTLALGIATVRAPGTALQRRAPGIVR